MGSGNLNRWEFAWRTRDTIHDVLPPQQCSLVAFLPIQLSSIRMPFDRKFQYIHTIHRLYTICFWLIVALRRMPHKFIFCFPSLDLFVSGRKTAGKSQYVEYACLCVWKRDCTLPVCYMGCTYKKSDNLKYEPNKLSTSQWMLKFYAIFCRPHPVSLSLFLPLILYSLPSIPQSYCAASGLDVIVFVGSIISQFFFLLQNRGEKKRFMYVPDFPFNWLICRRK